MSNVSETVQTLKDKINEVNELMKELDNAGVEVRISYVDSNKSKEITQGISLWRVVQHIDHL
jgi:23S rRNA C2498 (ribose-2'-O)-methylase RlmM